MSDSTYTIIIVRWDKVGGDGFREVKELGRYLSKAAAEAGVRLHREQDSFPITGVAEFDYLVREDEGGAATPVPTTCEVCGFGDGLHDAVRHYGAQA
jgi:hypothetical protein